MPLFLTRHSEGFPLTEGRIDPNQSPYAEVWGDYPKKVLALAQLIDEPQFLWAVEKARGFTCVATCKPVQWEVNVPQERVLGYIDEEKWLGFLQDKFPMLPPCFSKTKPSSKDVSVLLPFPLFQNEVVRVYRVDAASSG